MPLQLNNWTAATNCPVGVRVITAESRGAMGKSCRSVQSSGGASKKNDVYIHSVLPLFLHGEALFCIMGKDTVEHMLQGPIQYAQQNSQIRHENYGLDKEFRAGKLSNDRAGWKPGMLSWRFQNINSSSKPLDSF